MRVWYVLIPPVLPDLTRLFSTYIAFFCLVLVRRHNSSRNGPNLPTCHQRGGELTYILPGSVRSRRRRLICRSNACHFGFTPCSCCSSSSSSCSSSDLCSGQEHAAAHTSKFRCNAAGFTFTLSQLHLCEITWVACNGRRRRRREGFLTSLNGFFSFFFFSFFRILHFLLHCCRPNLLTQYLNCKRLYK